MLRKINKFSKYLYNNKYLSGIGNFKDTFDIDDEAEANAKKEEDRRNIEKSE